MKIFSYKKFVLETTLTVQETQRLLDKEVRIEIIGFFWKPFQLHLACPREICSEDSRFFVGKIRQKEFVIYPRARKCLYSKRHMPRIWGSICSGDRGANIHIKMGMPIWFHVLGQCILWSLYVLLGSGIYHRYLSGSLEHGTLLGFILFPVLWIVAFSLPFRREMEKAKRKLYEMFGQEMG